ncbi:MAG: hypothetical protein K6G22_14830 [Lachnospiraceae bacterium]|nr:hypothetical protein [Lachnospiraceae bacterium]
MKKEERSYIRNLVKKEIFYIDLISGILSFIICILTLLIFLNQKLTGLIGYVFSIALLISGLNAYKGYKYNTPTKRMYLLFSVISFAVMIYSLIVL